MRQNTRLFSQQADLTAAIMAKEAKEKKGKIIIEQTIRWNFARKTH